MDDRRATLEDAITAVAAQAKAQGVKLSRTKLVKLLYFIDLAAWRTFGRTVTGVEWIWHKFGPYSSSVIDAVERMSSEDELQVIQTNNYYGSVEYRIESVRPAYYEPASADLVGLIRGVLHQYGHMSPTEIGDASYETEPMRQLIRSEGRRGQRIEFDCPPPREVDVDAVVDRYRQVLKPSSDEGDVAAGLREEMDALDDARRASNSALLPH